MKYLVQLSLLTLLLLKPLYAKSYCSDWVQQNGRYCILNGQTENIWRRYCDNPCSYYGRGNSYNCDNERFCWTYSPSRLEGNCTEWVKEDGVFCYDPRSNGLKQKWVRACLNGYRTQICGRPYR